MPISSTIQSLRQYTDYVDEIKYVLPKTLRKVRVCTNLQRSEYRFEMEETILTLHSSIKPSLKKNKLLQGSILAILGVSLWLYCGIFLSINILSTWGWLALMMGGVLITFGLMPYRQLTRLENNPHQIVVTDLEELYFSISGAPVFTIALENIEEMAYLDDDKRYGIGLWIKKPIIKNVHLLNPSLNFDAYLKNTQKQYFCDIFLPYFSKRSFQEFEDLYKNI